MMVPTLSRIILTAVSLLVWLLYVTLRRTRFSKHQGLPRPPPSLIWGHLKLIGEYVAKGDPRRHIGA